MSYEYNDFVFQVLNAIIYKNILFFSMDMLSWKE
jgi:hypothetical protein